MAQKIILNFVKYEKVFDQPGTGFRNFSSSNFELAWQTNLNPFWEFARDKQSLENMEMVLLNVVTIVKLILLRRKNKLTKLKYCEV